ncbi:hypothetical protein BRCON_2044 [Candidatus Sumerlaea chitinivorans]|uniref:Uncharacterized protein n=1 Tax=Sumerlaea chitinivorans TaxID=2250252 RepID=A0A2Z4Y6M7_SUMC1|nr:hypothetical protein BRCON_2044 [Candidatus Sumerlaea chitinivorans]
MGLGRLVTSSLSFASRNFANRPWDSHLARPKPTLPQNRLN